MISTAKEDLKEIYDFIAPDSKKYATSQILQIRERTNVLKEQQYAGKVVEEYETSSIRELTISHYRIIYRVVSDDLIHIILIHHGARRFPRI